MSYQVSKISPTFRPNGASPIRYGDQIRWHYASFMDLKTEKSEMVACSFLAQPGAGTAGYKQLATDDNAWLLAEVYQRPCFLGEKNIWRIKEGSKETIVFFMVFWHNGRVCEGYERIVEVDAAVKNFKIEVLRESASFSESSNTDAMFELEHFSCASFKDIWFGEYLMPFNYLCNDWGSVVARRACNQGFWALALRRLGRMLRETEE